MYASNYDLKANGGKYIRLNTNYLAVCDRI